MRFRNRLRNAWAALMGRTKPVQLASVGIELNVDSAKFEADIERAKAQVEWLVEATRIPSPRLMVQCDRPLSSDARARIQELVKEASSTNKTVILEQGITVFQLIGGQWLPLSATPPIGDSPLRPAFEATGLAEAAERYAADYFAGPTSAETGSDEGA